MAPPKTSQTGNDVAETQVVPSTEDHANQQSVLEGMLPFTLDKHPFDTNYGLVNEPGDMQAGDIAAGFEARSWSSGGSTQASSSEVGDEADNEGGAASATKLQKVTCKHLLATVLARMVDQAEKLVGLDDGTGPSTSATPTAATPTAPTPAPTPAPAHEGPKDRIYAQFFSKIMEGVANLGPESEPLSQMLWILANLVRDAYSILKTLTAVMVEDARRCRDEEGRDALGGPRSAAADSKGKAKEETDAATGASEAL